MPKITASNMRDYYDFVATKEGGSITVLVGRKKVMNPDPTHPPFIIFKQGLGADKDLEASIKLQGKAPGFLPVIEAGHDYFIRAAYPDRCATKWSAVKGQKNDLMEQLIQLSLVMLNEGVIDRDRSVVKGVGDNLAARNLVIADKLYFFDFEPIRMIDWSKKLTPDDVNAIEQWKTTHENLIKGFATNLGIADVEAALVRLREGAAKILSGKSVQAAKAWEAIVTPVEDAGSSYEPPPIRLTTPEIPTARVSTPSTTTTTTTVRSTAELTVKTVFDMIGEVYRAANTPSFFGKPSMEETIEKIARVMHVVNNRHGTSYDGLEAMIAQSNNESFKKFASHIVQGTQAYLEAAYSQQLHDKDELWARPKGPWGP